MLIVSPVTSPPEIVAVAIAVTPLEGADIVTVGTPVYPTPGVVMVNAFITVDPEETVAVAVALEDGGVNVTVGDISDGNAYPLPPPVITGAPIAVGDINAVAIPPVPNAF